MSPRATSKLVAFLFLSMAGGAAAQSRTFSVNTTDDTPDAVPGDGLCADAGGSCSLRAAIMEANTGVGATGDNIDVPAGLYRITLGPLEVTASMTINGATTGRATLEGATAGTGVFELGSALYARKVFQGTDTVTGALVPRAVVTRSTADFPPGQPTVINCLQAEGCLGKAGLVDVGGVSAPTPIHPVSFDFIVSPAERAAVAGFHGLGILRVEAARDLGHKLGVARVDVVSSTLDGVGADALFQDTIDSCPPGDNEPINLACGPNFHTDKIGLSSGTIPEANFQAAAGDGNMQVVLSPVTSYMPTASDVGRLKIFSVELLYLKQVFVTLKSLTVQGASNSAFLNNGASLKGFDLVVKDSSAPVGAGFWNQFGSLILQDCTIAGNTAFAAGGIFNAALGLVDLDRCSVSGNRADVRSGGGILNDGILYLYNSTVSGNLARLGGGGIHNEGYVVANFSTITDNSANLDLSKNFDEDAVGGGIANVLAGRVDLANSILAGNRDGRDSGLPFPADLVSPDCFDVAAPPAPPLRNFLSLRDNRVGILNAACDLRDSDATVTGIPFDKAGSDGAPLDAVLGPLADNGGFTRTHALEPGSPAIDADDDASLSVPCLTTDQRGFRRPGDDPGDTICDVGAYEAGGRTVLLVDPNAGSSPVSVTFSNINQPGVTRLNVRSSGPPPPSGFTLGNPPLYFELSTTTTFSPPLIVCIDYSGTTFQNDTTLRLYHYENVNGTLVPIDRTFSLDTVKKVICASVDSFSLFAPFERVNRPPKAKAGPNQRLECEGGQGAHATLDGSASSDPDGDSLRFEWKDAAGAVVGSSSTVSLVLPLGHHPFRLEVTDTSGLKATDSVVITVRDTSPPVITHIAAHPDVLWPANNKMVPVTVDVSVTDHCDSAARCRIVSVRSDERRSGDDPDWQIVGDLTVKLRAERSSHGRGRTYTIVVACRDAAGNRTTGTVTVRVPHDHR